MALLLMAGCHDLTLPDPPAPPVPGVIQGALAYAQEGRSTVTPAGGATIQVERQSLSATSDGTLGVFRLAGVKSSEGSLLVRYTDPRTGVPYARSFSLAQVGAGFGKDVVLGTIMLGHLSAVGGKVLLADDPGPSGHAGTTVFIPEGPALALTADDGSFILDKLPEGPFTLSVFRAGYVSQTVTGDLGPAEQFEVRTLTLEQDMVSPPPSTLSGRVLLLDTDDASGVQVTARGRGDGGLDTTAADGTYTLPGLVTGLYDLGFSKPGYRQVTLRNVLARPGPVDVGTVVLPPQVGDAGPPPAEAPDGGPDAGLDGGSAPGPYYAPGLAVVGLLRVHGGQAFNLTVAALGADPTRPLTLAAPVAPAGATLTALGVGAWSFQWDTGFPTSGSFPVTFQLEDGVSVVRQSVTLTVDRYNLPPLLSGPLPTRTLVAGVTLTLQLSAQDPNQDPLTFSMSPAGHAGAALTPHGDGTATFTFTPTAADLGTTQLFTFTVSDGTLGAQQSLSVNVSGGSSLPPVWDPLPPSLAVSETGTLTLDVRASDPNGYPLTLGTSQLPTSATFSDRGDGSGQLVYSPGYDVVTAGATRVMTVGLVATDSHALATPLTFQVTVNDTPRPPLITHHADLVMGELSSAQVVTAAVDPDAHPLTYTFAVAPLASGLLGVGVSQDGGANVATLTAPLGSRGSYRVTAGVSNSSFSATDSYNLTVVKQPVLSVTVSGSGSVTSTPASLACTADGGSCSGTYAYGAAVTLSATPSGGAQFGGWTGACADAGLATSCALTLATDTSARAAFGTYFNLSVSVTGGGGVSADAPPIAGCGPTSGVCAGSYQAGSTVLLTASPSAGNALSTWGGSCADAGGSTCAVAMSAARAASATFAPVTAFSVVQGDQQSGWSDGPLPSSVMVALASSLGGAPTVGAPVTLTGPPGSVVTPSPALTDSLGHATFGVRLARTLGTQSFVASTPTAPNTLTVTATALAPDAGVVSTLVNVDHVASLTGVPGPGTVARITGPTGLALAQDGTLYIAGFANNQIFALSPGGVLSVVAGTGACGHTGDNGPALAATICNPYDLALDETHARKTLYVIDGNVVRAVDLTATTPGITTFAGNPASTAIAPDYGDRAPANVAALHAPLHLAVDPAGSYLYLVDSGINRFRRVSLSSGLIDAWFSPPANTSCTANNTYYGGAADCAIGFDQGGAAYVSYAAGNLTWATQYPAAVYRVSATGTATLVAGGGSSAADGIATLSASMPQVITRILFDPAGNLYVVERPLNRVRRVEAGVARIGTVAGTGTAGYVGDYTDARQAQLNAPWTALFDANLGLIVADTGNSAVRVVWGLGAVAPAYATLSIASGNNQSVLVDQLTPGLLAAQLLDPAGQPLSGYGISWSVLDPGGALFSASTVTSSSGVVTALARPGSTPGASYRYTASFNALSGPVPSSPVTFTVNTTAPDSGTIFTLVNVDHSAGGDGYPGGGTKAHLNGPTGLALSQDGTLFIAGYNNHQVFALSAAGALSVVAGTGTCGHTGDGQDATLATLCNPLDLALDETHARKTLYVIDGTALVRAIDLTQSPARITTFAGGGTAPPPSYGDGNAAAYAVLSSPAHLAVGPTGDYLYIVDTGIARFRRVDLGSPTPTINTWLSPPANTSCTANNTYYGGLADCAIGFDPGGTAYVSYAAGNAVWATLVSGGIYRVSAAGATTLVAGGGATTGEGIQAVGASIPQQLSRLFFDPAGNLYFVDRPGSRIRRVEAGVGRLTTFLGTGAAGYAGDFVDRSLAQLNSPFSALFDPGRNLIVSDYGNNAVRAVWAAGASSFAWATLGASTGAQQTVVVDQVASAVLGAQLLDPASQPLVGYVVYWNVVDPGGAVFLTSAVTNTLGIATTPARPGLAAGVAYRATASYSALAGALPTSPVTFTMSTAAPTPGTMLSVVDVDHTAANDGIPGPATRAHLNAPGGLATAADGTVYVASYGNHQIYALSPAGYLTVVAGTGACGTFVENSVATAALLCNPLALALDETHGNRTLYVLQANVVRAMNLLANPPTVATFAGGQTGLQDPYGDNLPAATSAMLSSPQHLVIPPAGDYLYIVDNGIGRIRRVDLLLPSHVITTWLTIPGATPPGSTSASITSCTANNNYYGGLADCSLAFDPTGTPYVSYAAGNQVWAAQVVGGVYRVDGTFPSLTPVRIAGGGSNAGEGVLATSASVPATVSQLFFSPAGSLYLLDRTGNRGRKLSDLTASATISTVLGTGVAGNGADFLTPLATALNAPSALALTPDGKMLVTDTNNHTVRIVWPPYP